MPNLDNLPISCEPGEPVRLWGALCRIVGHEKDGSLMDVNGTSYWSIVMVASPHGTTVRTGIFHLERLTEEEKEKLHDFEMDAENKGVPLYAGLLDLKK